MNSRGEPSRPTPVWIQANISSRYSGPLTTVASRARGQTAKLTVAVTPSVTAHASISATAWRACPRRSSTNMAAYAGAALRMGSR